MFSMIQGRNLGFAAGPKKVERLALPDGNDFPISSAVAVRAGVDTFLLSGALAPVINKDAPKDSVAAPGALIEIEVVAARPR